MNQLDTQFVTLKGFDRRGCVASLNNFTSTSWKCTGEFSDSADFAVVYIYKAIDEQGHLFTSKYLPEYDLSGVVLDFDLSGLGFQFPTSTKFQSVPWGKLSYILKDGTSGTVPLNITSTSGGIQAFQTFTVTSPGPAAFDRVNLIYLGNTVFDYVATGGESVTTIAANLVTQINTSTDISASNSAGVITIKCIEVGTDGNNIGIMEMHKNSNLTIVPSGNTNLSGGTNYSLAHITLDFTSLLGATNAAQVQEMWLTIAPQIFNTAQYSRTEFNFEVTNWTVTNARSLNVAGLDSIVIDAQNAWVQFTGMWSKTTGPGWYLNGVAYQSSTVSDRITITYWSQDTHDLYGNFLFGNGNGSATVTLDGTSLSSLSTNRNIGTPISAREKITSSVSSGQHTIEFQIISGLIVFDYLHIVVSPVSSFNVLTLDTSISSACDFDTSASNGVSPLYLVNRHLVMSFGGKLDFYGGVFFAHRRHRKGGYFPTVVCQISGTLNPGNGFGGGTDDTFFITISGTTIGAAVYPADTISTIAERLKNGINSIFVAARAFTTSTPGELKIVCVSPIYTFTFSSTSTTFSGATFTTSGSLGVGNEGIWEIDSTNNLTRGYLDFIADLDTICNSNSIALSIAYSQELLAPPDLNSAGHAWIQRFSNGESVLTATGFGLWGAGLVNGVSGTTIQQIGHGYLDGYRWHGANGGTSYAFLISIVDSDHFTLGTRLDGGSSTPTVGDSTFVELQTSQCSFNSYVQTYMASIYSATLATATHAGLQLGEIGWWFFNNSTSMSYYDVDLTAEVLISLGRTLVLFTTPNDDPGVNGFADANFLRTILSDYITGIISIVGGSPVWEVLYPYDVNFHTQYQNVDFPFNTGGRLNNFINTPAIFLDDSGSIQSLLLEALAWGTSYSSMDNSVSTVKLPFFSPWNWPQNKVRYLIPWQNYGCPWKRETLEALRYHTNLCYWAVDHILLMSWNIQKLKNSEVS